MSDDTPQLGGEPPGIHLTPAQEQILREGFQQARERLEVPDVQPAPGLTPQQFTNEYMGTPIYTNPHVPEGTSYTLSNSWSMPERPYPPQWRNHTTSYQYDVNELRGERVVDPLVRVVFDHLHDVLRVELSPRAGTTEAMMVALERGMEEIRGVSEGVRLYDAYATGVVPGVLEDWGDRLLGGRAAELLPWPVDRQMGRQIVLPQPYSHEERAELDRLDQVENLGEPSPRWMLEANRRVVRQDYEPVRRVYVHADPVIGRTSIEATWWTWEMKEAVGRCRVLMFDEGVGWWQQRAITADQELPEGAEYILRDPAERYTAPDWVFGKAREVNPDTPGL